VKQCQYPFSGTPLDSTIAHSGNASQISLQFGWLINNGIFNKPIIAHTQILVHRWGPGTRVLALFHRCTNTKSLGSSVVQVILCQAFTHFFHFTVVNIIEQSPIAKKIWLSIHPRNFGNHVLSIHLSRLNSKWISLQWLQLNCLR